MKRSETPQVTITINGRPTGVNLRLNAAALELIKTNEVFIDAKKMTINHANIDTPKSYTVSKKGTISVGCNMFEYNVEHVLGKYYIEEIEEGSFQLTKI